MLLSFLDVFLRCFDVFSVELFWAHFPLEKASYHLRIISKTPPERAGNYGVRGFRIWPDLDQTWSERSSLLPLPYPKRFQRVWEAV